MAAQPQAGAVAGLESGRITGLRDGELDLAATLRSGQVFRWVQDADGAVRGTVGTRRMRLGQSEEGGTLCWEANGPGAAAVVRSFLRLDDADLPALAEAWCREDP